CTRNKAGHVNAAGSPAIRLVEGVALRGSKSRFRPAVETGSQLQPRQEEQLPGDRDVAYLGGESAQPRGSRRIPVIECMGELCLPRAAQQALEEIAVEMNGIVSPQFGARLVDPVTCEPAAHGSCIFAKSPCRLEPPGEGALGAGLEAIEAADIERVVERR